MQKKLRTYTNNSIFQYFDCNAQTEICLHDLLLEFNFFNMKFLHIRIEIFNDIAEKP